MSVSLVVASGSKRRGRRGRKCQFQSKLTLQGSARSVGHHPPLMGEEGPCAHCQPVFPCALLLPCQEQGEGGALGQVLH